MQQGIRRILGSLKPSFAELRKNDPLRMAGATAFFTTFALPPIIFILIQLLGFFIGRRNIGQQLIEAVSGTLGAEGALQVRQVLRSIRGLADSWYLVIGGFIFLLFVATTLFGVIKNSFNQLWSIGIREKPGFLFALQIRLRSLAAIVFAGLLFIADLFFESLETIAGNYVELLWKGGGPWLKGFLHEVLGVIIIAAWFVVLFRYLADARPSWKASITGGILTGILFTVGKLLLQYLLVNSNIGVLYGASGSMALILLFVFYSSFILYYGASFVYIYSQQAGLPVTPIYHAYNYRMQELD